MSVIYIPAEMQFKHPTLNSHPIHLSNPDNFLVLIFQDLNAFGKYWTVILHSIVFGIGYNSTWKHHCPPEVFRLVLAFPLCGTNTVKSVHYSMY